MNKFAAAILAVGLLLTAIAAPRAQGQTLPLGAGTATESVGLPALNTLRYGRADTLRAVRHLFMRRSRAMRVWLEGGASLMATGAVKKTVVAAKSKAKRRDNPYYDNLDESGSGDLLVGTLMAGYGAFRYARFGPGQYQRVVAAYQEGQPLPPYLDRKLKTKYFRLLPVGSRKVRAEAVGE